MADNRLPPLRDVIARHGLQAKKSLGQNFLLDGNLLARIARAAGPLTGETVIEIGPGPGGLTRALLEEGAARVIGVEFDTRALPALAEIAAAYPGRLSVIEGDALKIDTLALVPAPFKIIANLPYNIATPLLTGWLTADPWPPPFTALILMFQREVALRLTAQPGDAAYGRLSVLAGWRTRARRLFDIDPHAFVPSPKVTSSLVELIPQPDPPPCDVKALERVTAAAFGQRRKMLRQSLKALGGDPLMLLETAGIEPTFRAEDVSVEGFVRMARMWSGQAS